ncbi:MAG: MOSC domain-containing protein, partial [Methylococcaceae bacterium]
HAQCIPHAGRMIETGIYKLPVTGPIHVTKEGLIGDVQVDRKNHGGPDKAIYVYTEENHHHWAKLLGQPHYGYGYFGENFTVTDLQDDTVHIGDIFSMGETIVQVTQPRVPCFKLGLKFGDPAYVGEFLTSGRTGFYLRVIREGLVHSGDTIRLLSLEDRPITVSDAMRALIKHPEQRRWIEKVLAVDALSSAWREVLRRRLNSD